MSLIDGGHSHETTPLAGPRASSAERTDLQTRARLKESRKSELCPTGRDNLNQVAPRRQQP
jgi:hypothetical protein